MVLIIATLSSFLSSVSYFEGVEKIRVWPVRPKKLTGLKRIFSKDESLVAIRRSGGIYVCLKRGRKSKRLSIGLSIRLPDARCAMPRILFTHSILMLVLVVGLYPVSGFGQNAIPILSSRSASRRPSTSAGRKFR